MQFNVNESVVKMLQVLADHPSLQILAIVALIAMRLPELIRELKK